MAKFQLGLLISNGDNYLEDVFTSFNYDLDKSLDSLYNSLDNSSK